MSKPAKKQKFRLTDLVLSEVSLVDRPANPHATVVLFKRDDSTEETNMDELKKQLDALQAEKAALEVVKADSAKQIAFLTESLEKLNARVTKAEAERDELAKAAEAAKPPAKPELPKAAQEQIDKALADVAKANEELAKMRDEKDTLTYVAKAETLKGLAQKPEEFGLVLKNLATNKATAEDFAALETVLKAANAAIEKGVLSPAGKDGVTSSVAADKIEAIAKSIQSAEKVSYEVAYTKAIEQNPKLYTQYCAENQ